MKGVSEIGRKERMMKTKVKTRRRNMFQLLMTLMKTTIQTKKWLPTNKSVSITKLIFKNS